MIDSIHILPDSGTDSLHPVIQFVHEVWLTTFVAKAQVFKVQFAPTVFDYPIVDQQAPSIPYKV